MVSAQDPRWGKVTSASLTDAMDQLFDHEAHLTGLTSPTPERRLIGPACTVRFVPVREEGNGHAQPFKDLFYRAIGEDGQGKVMVFDTAGQRDLAIVGGIKATRLEHNGLAGLLGDCRFRDFDEIRELDLSCWSWGEGIQAGSSRLMAVAANGPAVVDGVTILPGDWVYVDQAGAVILPGDDVDRVLDAAVAKEERDVARAEAVRKGKAPGSDR
ncbi:MAG: RraA family protein [Candidatus Thermoplasmatota archaeon]|nr:RraA family protein [Candidatus Thermoplasmatota archaeon]